MLSDQHNNIDRDAVRREREGGEGGGGGRIGLMGLEREGEEEEIGVPIPMGYGSSSSKVNLLTGGNGTLTIPPIDEEERLPVPVAVAVAVAGGGVPSKGKNIKYQECLKNHAASIGGHAVDGCCEFMPSGEEGTLEALKCAACNCHRNFHRRDAEDEAKTTPNCYYCYNLKNNNDRKIKGIFNPPPQQKFSLGLPTSSPLVPQMIMAFGGGATESSSEDLNNAFQSNAAPPIILSKKRFRTKFSQDQKEKMSDFAEKLGWRIQKQDEGAVQQFCAEVGVKRHVLKVWMHNNKHTMKKPQ